MVLDLMTQPPSRLNCSLPFCVLFLFSFYQYLFDRLVGYFVDHMLQTSPYNVFLAQFQNYLTFILWHIGNIC